MPRPAPLSAVLGIAAAALLAAPVAAQTEFAVPLAPGTLRVDFTPLWSSWDHRYQPGATGPVSISDEFGAESLGVQTWPFLAPWRSQIQDATGLPGFSVNLGHTQVTLNASVRTLPIGLELGLSRWLSVGVTVPIVRSRVDASFLVNQDSAAARHGNVGWNPGWLDSTTVATFRAQMTAALAALQTQATSGPPALRSQAQAAIAALQPFLTVSRTPLLPLANTLAAESILTRFARADTAYAQLGAQYQAFGDTLPPLSSALTLPDSTSTLQRGDLERMLSDSTLPVAADTFGTVVKTGIGDITAHATLQFANGRRYRAQVVFTTRFPTGSAPSATSFLDLGTGTHQLGFEGALANDLLLGERFLIHGVARYGSSMADQVPMRVTPPGLPFAVLAQQAVIRRQPSPYVALDLAPTWMLDDAFSVRVAYDFFTQGATRYSYVTAGDSARVGTPASVLDQDTGMRWMRLGGGVTFSTLDRYTRGRASLPYSVTVGYENTIWGGGGRVPRISAFHINFRAYVKVWK